MFVDRSDSKLNSSRVKQPWPKGRPFKILSLDGGGIRGIFSAKVIAEISTYLPVGDNISQYFDLISGTSTGGIIAIAIGLGKDPKDILDLYLKEGKVIFPPFWTRHRAMRFAKRLFWPIHNHAALEKALRREFESQHFGDSSARLVIPAFLGPSPQIAVFKTDHHPDYRQDWRTTAWEVARATSAAPTFFEGHRYNRHFFLDGGLWANNPMMCAAVEALSSYDIQPNQISILSVGTGTRTVTLKQSLIRAGMLGWRGALSTAMFLTTETALSQARLLVGFDNVVRMEPSEAGAAIELDDWTNASALLPKDALRSVAENVEAIRMFLTDRVHPRERFYSSSP